MARHSSLEHHLRIRPHPPALARRDTAPTIESRTVAESFCSEWTALTIGDQPHPERLHPNRFERYHGRVMLALLKRAPIVIGSPK